MLVGRIRKDSANGHRKVVGNSIDDVVQIVAADPRFVKTPPDVAQVALHAPVQQFLIEMQHARNLGRPKPGKKPEPENAAVIVGQGLQTPPDDRGGAAGDGGVIGVERSTLEHLDRDTRLGIDGVERDGPKFGKTPRNPCGERLDLLWRKAMRRSHGGQNFMERTPVAVQQFFQVDGDLPQTFRCGGGMPLPSLVNALIDEHASDRYAYERRETRSPFELAENGVIVLDQLQLDRGGEIFSIGPVHFILPTHESNRPLDHRQLPEKPLLNRHAPGYVARVGFQMPVILHCHRCSIGKSPRGHRKLAVCPSMKMDDIFDANRRAVA